MMEILKCIGEFIVDNLLAISGVSVLAVLGIILTIRYGRKPVTLSEASIAALVERLKVIPPQDASEELKRLDRALACLRKHFPDAIISVDTYRADVAKAVVENYAVDIINDISAGTLDDCMFETVAALNVPYILMHIQCTPLTMQENPVYENLMEDIIGYFSKNVHRLRQLGVKDIIIDPGFGFGKTIEHNYEILRHLKDLKIFDLPILAGLSRKSMIYKVLETDAEYALNGTTVLNTLALVNGASILRVHDVKEAVECIKLVQMYRITE